MNAQVTAWNKPLRFTKVLDGLGARATWYRRAASASISPPDTAPSPSDAASRQAPAVRLAEAAPSRRGPAPHEAGDHEQHVIRTVAQACPWYGYKKIALICRRLDEPIAGTGHSAFSQVRIGYRMPTQLGLLERFHGTLKREEVYWNLYADPCDARQKLELFHERYNHARPHWALVATDPPALVGTHDPTKPPARVLTPHEVYVRGCKVNPPKWSRWVGWLEKDQKPEALPPHKITEKISA